MLLRHQVILILLLYEEGMFNRTLISLIMLKFRLLSRFFTVFNNAILFNYDVLVFSKEMLTLYLKPISSILLLNHKFCRDRVFIGPVIHWFYLFITNDKIIDFLNLSDW